MNLEGAVAKSEQESERTGDIPLILSGTIDLVFKEDGGWVIVDYKTDVIRLALAQEDLADLVRLYGPQVKLYSRFWEQITGAAGQRIRPLLHLHQPVGENLNRKVSLVFCFSREARRSSLSAHPV